MRFLPFFLLISCDIEKPGTDSQDEAISDSISGEDTNTEQDEEDDEPSDSAEPPEDTSPPTDSGDTDPVEPVDLDGDGVDETTDCNDANPAIYPGAEEICDGIDNNCNDEIDEDLITMIYPDGDGDGYGRTDDGVRGCTESAGFSILGNDCNDADDRFYPGAPESDCSDPSDYNCDGSVGYVDADGDGFAACEECHDMDPSIHPDATEICDHIDNDCDGLRDDDDDGIDPSTLSIFYTDEDEDGYGNEDIPLIACFPSDGAVGAEPGFDCDDENPAIHPDADEVCDEIDNDCDDEIDDDDADRIGGLAFYIDHDSDGYGSSDYTVHACESPAGYVDNSDDCDDLNGAIHPAAEEQCDGIDNNCDAAIDGDDAIDPSTWFLDEDGDLFGVDEITVATCTKPDGYAEVSGDCNDAVATTYPGAAEACDEVDNDCDGLVDGPDAEGTGFWYADDDLDGFGDPDSLTMSCELPAGHVDNSEDCDDDNGAIHPDADELCDAIDNNCDGLIDGDDATDRLTWYADTDLDGFGDAASATSSCVAPPGYGADASDCDDTNAAIHPDAIESCDGMDNNCDLLIDGDDAVDQAIWFQDEDADGEGTPDISMTACDAPDGYVDNDRDCDDAHAEAWSGGSEVCDGLDNDCDGDFDEDFPSSTWYRDSDGDFQGDPESTVTACARPDGYVDNDADCDDTTDAVFSGAPEHCFDGLDNNCDLETDCEDVDDCRVDEPTCWTCGDGFVDPGEECDDGDLDSGDGCSSSCTDEVDLSDLETSWFNEGRNVYVFKSDSSAPLSGYDNFCETKGLSWYVPTSSTDADKTIADIYNLDSWHTWIVTKNNTTTSPQTWGGYPVYVCSGETSSSGFSGIRQWGSCMCDPDDYGVTKCWDSDHSYDWLVCMD